jgi:hypothetical protein
LARLVLQASSVPPGRLTMSRLESIAFSLIAGCAGLLTVATIVPVA